MSSKGLRGQRVEFLATLAHCRDHVTEELTEYPSYDYHIWSTKKKRYVQIQGSRAPYDGCPAPSQGWHQSPTLQMQNGGKQHMTNDSASPKFAELGRRAAGQTLETSKLAEKGVIPTDSQVVT